MTRPQAHSIRSVSVGKTECRLKKPYVLSFGTLDYLTSIQVALTTEEGLTKTAETVPLVGYSEETVDSVLEFLGSTTGKLHGLPLAEARAMVAAAVPHSPFACSPILTAIDLFGFETIEPDLKAIDFVTPSSAENLQELKNLLESAEAKGGATLKVKLSGKTSADISCFEFLSTLTFTKSSLRFDANKAYTLSGACAVYDKLKEMPFLPQVHYVEQPLPVDQWNETRHLIDTYPTVKTMLDESIVTREDLKKAIHINVPFVKFKLFKQGGISELLELMHLAAQYGQKMVLGNGVASKLSNDIENYVFLKYRHLLFGASEANGFLKISE